jgi:hypothetical protein
MARLNVKNKVEAVFTHEGAKGVSFDAEKQLRRALMNCLLWEDQFYEDGVSIAERIKTLVGKVKPEVAASLAITARNEMKLRHAPLLVVREMARIDTHKHLVADTLERVIQRADELSEFLAIYWAGTLGLNEQRKKQPLSAQVKKGLAKAFTKFDAYQLAKYNRDAAVKLKDVLFMTYAKPKDEAQALLWKQLIDGTLASPDTWEVELSAGKDKKETFTRLLSEKKLGALALLRNLRNMEQAGVDRDLIRDAMREVNVSRVFPYRFLTAATYAPSLEDVLEKAMFKAIEGTERLNGRTALLVDISGSMREKLSGKSEVTRMDAAAGLAVLAREICDDVAIFSFDTSCREIKPRRGFALKEAILASGGGGTMLGAAIDYASKKSKYDRMIVITDEQSHDRVEAIKGTKCYMINVASYQNGVGYGPWTRLDGFSESVIRWIVETEKS